MKTTWIGAIALALLALACKQPPDGEPPIPLDLSLGIFILNEGNFNWGNASLDFIDGEGAHHSAIFSDSNQIPLGDVAQSIYRYNDDLYIVVNNSGAIHRVDGQSMKVVSSATGLTSPRYLAFLSPAKAYATDLYADAITIFNPASMQVTGQIPVGSWTEELLNYGGTAYVCQMGSDKLLLIDPNTDALLDSIYVGREPNSLVADKNGKLWVLCSGGINEAAPRLVRFDPDSRSVDRSFLFADTTASPSELRINPAGDQLYFLNGDLYQMPIAATNLPVSPLAPANGRQFYHLEVERLTGDLLVTDAVDYVQQGALHRYRANGEYKEMYPAGIIPGDVLVLP